MPLLIEAPPMVAAKTGPLAAHRFWSTAPLLDLVLQHLSPPALLACLAVSSAWYRSALPVLLHAPRLRSSADVVSFFGGDGRAGPDSRARKLDGLRWVREIELATGCVPDELVTLAHLKRALAGLGASGDDPARLLPRLQVLRLSYTLEGWTQLLTPPINVTSAAVYSRPEQGVEVLSERSPPLVSAGLIRVLQAPTVVFSNGDGPDTGETHVHLLPTQQAQLVTLVAPFRHAPLTSWVFDRTFFHTVRERYHPLPTLLRSKTEGRTELHFNPLSQRSRTTPGLSLNPWDRRQTLLSLAASVASPSSPVVVHGVPLAHLDTLPEAEGLTFVSTGEEDDIDTAAARSMPSLTDEQVGALFYRGLSVGWSALSQRIMSFGAVRV